MIAAACRYMPEELFAGFGEKAMRLDPHPKAFSCAESCAHPNLCSYCKAVLEEVMTRPEAAAQEQIGGIVMTDCCDAARRTYDVLREAECVPFLYLLSLPHRSGSAETKRFAQALRDLAEAFEAFTGVPFDAERATAAYCAVRAARLPAPEGAYIRLAGAHGGTLLKDELRRIFADREISDETCTGKRFLTREPGSAEEFFDWYAEALLSQPAPCMRMQDASPSAPLFAAPPDGTVFHTIKFCDYYGFAFAEEKTRGEKLLKIETDMTPQASGQLVTRLEAFREELDMNHDKKKAGSAPRYAAGIDSGSTSTEAVVMDGARHIIGKALVATGRGVRAGAEQALNEALAQAGITAAELSSVTATGYGRASVSAGGNAVTEITCHARGAHFLDPAVRTVIDIGGQDSKVIRIDEAGRVENFVMNDKCAAGTGRFLEMQARALGMPLEEMCRLGLNWKKEIEISSMCTVFAESEVVSLAAENTAVPDIVHGLNRSVANRTAALVARVGGKREYMMTGGVARNQGVRRCLEEKLGERIFVLADAQYCGAIGAALIALENGAE